MNSKPHKIDLFTEKIKAGRRTYFFDLKENLDGEKYLVITESKPTKDDGFRRDRILVYSDYVEEFSEVFNKMAENMKKKNK